MKPKLSIFALFSAVCASLGTAHSAPAGKRHIEDEADLAIMKDKHPEARVEFDRGEVKLAAGEFQAAQELFERVRKAAPNSALAARRHCQALTELGRHGSALEACQRAISNGGTYLDHRAYVAAAMSGASAPTTDQLSTSMGLVEAIKRRVPSEPWGHAAECDIARRMGDESLLRKCTAELARVAPEHYETRRALVTAEQAGSSGWRWTAWITLLFACVSTALHALYGFGRRFAEPAGKASAALCFALMTGFAAPAAADSAAPNALEAAPTFSKWAINHADPVSSVPTPEQRDGNPLEYGYHLMDLTEAGDRAMKRKDFGAASRYFMALAKAVPDSSRGFALACEAFEALGNRQKGLEYCTVAISLPGVRLHDHRRYARLMLAKSGPLTPDEIADLTQVVGHVRNVEGGKDLAQDIECEIGLRNEDIKRLEQCSAALARSAPKGPSTIAYQFALALARKDEREQQKVIDFAKQAALPPAAIQRMEKAVLEAQPPWRRALGDWRILSVALVCLGAGGVMLVVARRRVRLRPA